MRIAVIGCGPGGLASALLLHRCGHAVTLFDQFAAPKPLGSGLLIQPSGQAVLAQLGVLEEIAARSAKVMRLHGINVSNGKRALDMEYRHLGAGNHAYGIHRASLFDVLFATVQNAGIRLETACKLVGATVSDHHVIPHFAEKEDAAPFDIMIDASGAHGPLIDGASKELPFAALWTSVDIPKGGTVGIDALDQRYVGARKMAGIMPIGINPETGNAGAALFWSIKPGEVEALKSRRISSWQQEFLTVWPEAEAYVQQITSFDDLSLAIYRHRTGSAVSQKRIFHIGDSWHCTSPQLGQGANMALIDAAAIAAVISGSDDVEQIARQYRYFREDHIGIYQLLSLIFTPLYQSDSRTLPVLRDAVIHYCARLPMVRSLIAQVVSGNLGNFANT